MASHQSQREMDSARERSGHLLGDGEAKVKRKLGIKNPEQGAEDGRWLMASGPARWLHPSPNLSSCAEDGRTSSPSSRPRSLGLVLAVVPHGPAASRGSAFIQVGAVL